MFRMLQVLLVFDASVLLRSSNDRTSLLLERHLGEWFLRTRRPALFIHHPYHGASQLFRSCPRQQTLRQVIQSSLMC